MKRIPFLLPIVMMSAISSFAQVEGNVVDTAGKAIPSAVIIAVDSARNVADTIKSDKIGYFAYKKLSRGKYKFLIGASGFQNAVFENIIVNNETPDDDKGGGDISNAIWIEFELKPLKSSK